MDPTRHFKNDEIRELFNAPEHESKFSTTQKQLEPIKTKRDSYPALDAMLERLGTCFKFFSELIIVGIALNLLSTLKKLL